MAVTMSGPRRKQRTTWTPAAIRALREELGLSVEQAAEKVNVSIRLWFYWEAGTRNPGGPALRLLDLLKNRKL